RLGLLDQSSYHAADRDISGALHAPGLFSASDRWPLTPSNALNGEPVCDSQRGPDGAGSPSCCEYHKTVSWCTVCRSTPLEADCTGLRLSPHSSNSTAPNPAIHIAVRC